MNMAALWHLPVIFCCINNQYGMGTRIDQATANPRLHERAQAVGVECVHPAVGRIAAARLLEDWAGARGSIRIGAGRT